MDDKIRKNLHIEILKFASKHTEFTSNQIFGKLNFRQKEKNLWVGSLIHNKTLIEFVRESKEEQGRENVYTISVEGRFKLLEYQQLRTAKLFGLGAIIITFIFAIASILIDLFHPIKVDNIQFEELKKINVQLEKMNEQNIKIQENQKILINVIKENIEKQAKSDRLK